MKTAATTICFLVLAAFAAQSPLQASEQSASNKDTEGIASKAPVSVSALKKKIVLNDMISLEPGQVTNKSNDLQTIIEKMNKLQIPPVKTEKADETSRKVSEKIGEHLPTETKSVPTEIETAKTIAAKSAESTNDIADMFDKLLKDPDKIVDPLAAGRALFSNNKLPKAAKFYHIALQRNEISEVAEGNLSRQWILFQMGNCLRKEDPDQSYKYYEQLIGEYPNSDWAPAARSHQLLIAWLKESQPTIILEKYTSDPNSL